MFSECSSFLLGYLYFIPTYRGFARQPCCMLQNIFIVPAMQLGCRAKPLYCLVAKDLNSAVHEREFVDES